MSARSVAFNDGWRDLALLFGHARSAAALTLHRAVGPMLRRPLSDEALGVALRDILDRSGVVGRKLGQFMAMRLDLLPRAVAAELDKLFDGADAMPFGVVQAVVEGELGRPLAQMFRSFDRQPIAVASIAQVHAAVARDGQPLAVKVQRAGISSALSSEIRILRRLATVSDALRLTGSLSAREALEEFAEFTWTELSFEVEAATSERLRTALGPRAHAPAVRWDLTSARVLSMEFVEGTTLLEVCRLHESGRTEDIALLLPGIDLRALVDLVARESFRQLFEVGLFHGDPNPGNIIIRPDGDFTFIDFGICGELLPEDRLNLRGYAESLVQGRCMDSARHYLRLCRPTSATRISELEVELSDILAQWLNVLHQHDPPIEQRHISVWQLKVAQLLRKYHVRTRRNLLLVWRAWVLLDSTALRLPVDFDLVRTQANYFAQSRLQRVAENLGPDPLHTMPGRIGDHLGRPGGQQVLHARVTRSAESSRRHRRNGVAVAFSTILAGFVVVICAAALRFN